MLTRDMDTLLINSDDPLEQVFSRARRSIRHLPSRSRLLLGRTKYTRGRLPPMNWLRAVAAAAPAAPQENTATNRASSTILVTPAATVIYSPSRGFSAVANRHWNSYYST